MKEENAIKLFRMSLGVILLVTHAVTNVNGVLVSTALVLLGLPVEMLASGKGPVS